MQLTRWSSLLCCTVRILLSTLFYPLFTHAMQRIMDNRSARTQCTQPQLASLLL